MTESLILVAGVYFIGCIMFFGIEFIWNKKPADYGSVWFPIHYEPKGPLHLHSIRVHLSMNTKPTPKPLPKGMQFLLEPAEIAEVLAVLNSKEERYLWF